MRVTALLAPLWLLGSSLVAANYDSRGPEVEYFYRAYRMDVDLSVAEFLADPANKDKTPEEVNAAKPWQLGRNIKAQNEDADWPKGDRGKYEPIYGLNFHAWLRGAQKSDSHYGITEARKRPGMENPLNPDFKAAFADVKELDGDGNLVYKEPRNNIARLPREDGRALEPMDPKDNSFKTKKSDYKYSYTGLNPQEIFGGLNEYRGGKPGNYWEFSNMLGVVAKRCSDLYERHHASEVAQNHYKAMARALKQGQEARRIESRKFQVLATYTKLEQYEKKKNLQVGTISKFPDILKTTPVVSPSGPDDWYPGWKSEEVDIKGTKKKWPKSLATHKDEICGNSKGKTKIKGVLREFADEWAKGDFSKIKDENPKDPKYGDRTSETAMGENHKHLQVIRAQERLVKGIENQLEDHTKSFTNVGANKCDWYKLIGPGEGGPGNGGIPDPLRRRMVLGMLREAMTPA